MIIKPSLRLMLAFLLVAQSCGVYAVDLDVPASERPQIRSRIRNCEVFLAPEGQLDDSVGIPFGGNSPDEFERELRDGISKYGVERFRNGVFYVGGVAMADEPRVQATFEKILEHSQLHEVGAKIKVLSVPSNLVRERAVSIARDVLERVAFFFPSLKRDLQKPQWGEVLTNWQSTALVESATVYFVYKSMPVTEATLVLLTHAAVLNAYSIYSKSMLNYLMRQGQTGKTSNAVELFLKQMALSLPFVLNFNIFGHFSDILNFYAVAGWDKTLAHFPYELSHFATTQGLTLALQTVFYSAIITSGFGGWVDRQVGDQNTRDARTVRPLIQVPILAADSVLMMFASSDVYAPLMSLGPFDVNVGHVGLAALTGAMWLFFKKFPKALDGILHKYQERKARKSAALAARALSGSLPNGSSTSTNRADARPDSI